MKPFVLLMTALTLACADDRIDRTEWQQMPRDERTLYVKSLLGEEQAKDAKGGRGRTYDRSAEEYVAMIDAAYERGESRDVRGVFAELSTSK